MELFCTPWGRSCNEQECRQRKTLMDEFKKSMEGIYSTSISKTTLDEAPFAYKPMDDILESLEETAEIYSIIKPIYNFKAQ